MKSKQPKKEKAAQRGGRPQATRLEKRKNPKGRVKKTHGEVGGLEGKVCAGCRLLFREGRWVWPSVSNPTGSPTLCPACERIRDRRPAGELRITGSFAKEHRSEILARARSVEEREKAEHPLQRIMDVREKGNEVVLTTTDPRLARGIGTALFDAYKGELDAPFAEKGELQRVHWRR